MDKGIFIVVEGIDGSGKSTLVRELAKELGDNAVSIDQMNTSVGKLIREKLSKSNDYKSNEMFAYLFNASRYELLYDKDVGIVKQLEKGKMVIGDRYYHSTLAYGTHNEEFLSKMLSLTNEFIVPDLVIMLDCDVDVAVERLKKEHLDIDTTEVYEDKYKLSKIVEKYKCILSIDHTINKRVLHLDATSTVEDNINVIKRIIPELYDNKFRNTYLNLYAEISKYMDLSLEPIPRYEVLTKDNYSSALKDMVYTIDMEIVTLQQTPANPVYEVELINDLSTMKQKINKIITEI